MFALLKLSARCSASQWGQQHARGSHRPTRCSLRHPTITLKPSASLHNLKRGATTATLDAHGHELDVGLTDLRDSWLPKRSP